MHDVKVWEESILIPTYPVGKAEKNPMFLERRVYQGSSGVVYPHAVIEKIQDVKTDVAYQAVFMENEFLKIMILPQLGGRIQMAFDKVKQRHFIYYNQVIKPALVGLTGPWISGGIEFNWPQHHRPSTFEPVDYTIRQNPDGSQTVWVNEVERMFRTKGMAGFTLYPGKAYLEVTGKLYNRTPFPQSFLWWANPAVKVNDHYQSVFPPDVYAVFDHGKRDVSSFPIAKGTYYKVNYAPGTDISCYKNIPVPTSYMAIVSKYDFIGGYEHDSGGGLLHVADHHVAPGKKQWTWGNGPFGQAWDKNLTDEDGPYIELMTGVYTDNQPDFSWLEPFEEKKFVQYFMPYNTVGMVKNASKDAVVNMEMAGEAVQIKVYVTAAYPALCIGLQLEGASFFEETVAAAPGTPYCRSVVLKEPVLPQALTLVVTDRETGKVLVRYQPEKRDADPEVPPPAQAALAPEEVENNEQLFLTGLHLEQYRHATYVATDYYEEALRRDPRDVRCNNAMGLWFLRKGQFSKAEPYLKAATATLTHRNPNPYDGTPFYNLGYALYMQDRIDEAYEAFYKCIWNDACQHAGYLSLARIASLRGDWEKGLDFIDQALIKNYHSHTARHAKVILLRKCGQKKEALALIEESLLLDPFNFGCLFEKYLLLETRQPAEAGVVLQDLQRLSRNWVHNLIEYAFDYINTGCYAEASNLLQLSFEKAAAPYPMVLYYLGWLALRQHQSSEALDYFRQAATADPAYCFPNRIEDVGVLQAAMALNAGDAKAPYYLGNFWYDKRQYREAIACWERSVAIDPSFPTAHRNLSLAYYNKLQDPSRARRSMETAFELDPSDARVLMELDQLYKKLNESPLQRLALLEKHLELVRSRDDLYLERITLYNQLGHHKTAQELLQSYRFHPWEGGEGKVVSQYLICQLELAKEAFLRQQYETALQHLQAAATYPDNLGEGKLPGTQENDMDYLTGLVFERLGDHQEAKLAFERATAGSSEPVQAIFYNDPQPDKILYQGLAWLKLGRPEQAHQIFQRLKTFGMTHMQDPVSIDYFAVSLPDLLVFDVNLSFRNKIHCLYLIALGDLGLAMATPSELEGAFDAVLKLDGNHQGALVHRSMAAFLEAVQFQEPIEKKSMETH